MRDKEILAELKESYELLQDIIDNNYNQLDSTKELKKAQNILADKYYEMYQKIKEKEDVSLYYKENIKIAPHINGDYVNKNNDYITSADLGEQKWWKDYSFIKEFQIRRVK